MLGYPFALAGLWIAASLFCAAPSIAAEPEDGRSTLVRVSAGDVGASSRVAFNFTPTGGFRVEQSDRQITVLFPGANIRFAFDEVYPRRRASRITFAGPEDRPNGAAFALRFTCDCAASIALDANQRVLVEVRDKEAVKPAEATSSATPARAAANAAPQPPPASLAGPAAQIAAIAGPFPRPRPAGRRPDDGSAIAGQSGGDGAPSNAPRPGPATGDETAAATARFTPPADGTLAADEISKLRQSLEWAARHGFMKRPGEADAEQPATDGDKPPANITNVQVAPQPKPQPAADPPPSRADSPVAADAAMASPLLPIDTTAWVCEGQIQPPLIDWNAIDRRGDNFSRAIGAQRAALIGLERVAAVSQMAMFYLSHGLTQEALAYLSAGNTPSPALVDAVLILLGRGQEAGDALLREDPCRRDIAVWRAALLNAHGFGGLAARAAKEAVLPLAQFAQHPRTVLALQLAEMALYQADADLASQFLDAPDPAPAQAVADRIALLQGRLALLLGQKDRANWYLSQAIEGAPENRRLARLALIEDALAKGEPPPDWAKDAVRGALFDYRGDSRLLPVALLAADLHAASGDVATALEELRGAAQRLPESVSRAPVDAKTRALLKKALLKPGAVDDATALQLYTDYRHQLAEDRDSQAILKHMASRMLAAGLPSVTERIVASMAAKPEADPRLQTMLAEARLRAGYPAEALATLDKAEAGDQPTADLRRRALAQLGRYADAAAVAMDKPENPGRAAEIAAGLLWANGDWSRTAAAYRTALATIDSQDLKPGDGDVALRALAAGYMAGGTEPLGNQAGRAMQIAAAAGFGDAAAALNAPPLPDNLTLPDVISAVLTRSQQVSQLFPAPSPGS